MTDMLVKLYDLPDVPHNPAMPEGIEFRRALPLEKRIVVDWVLSTFGDMWAAECDVSFSRQPVGCFLATQGKQIVGFACVDVTSKGFFGPTGVLEALRGKGIGTQLLLMSLRALRDIGYAYAIIGGAGPLDFYRKTVGAVPIEGSAPGVYRNMLVKE